MVSMMASDSVGLTEISRDKRLVGEMDVRPAAAMAATTGNLKAVEWVAKKDHSKDFPRVVRSVQY